MLFTASLLHWYEENARDLPWRLHQSPYHTWVSEIMLQQTQVQTVIPYFEHWIARFPDIEALAAASEQEVLSLWEGLGYYSRARNLHKAAKIVMADFKGELPDSLTALQGLPGIGPYTAAAIASIAFDEDAAAIDGNIRRVFSRLYNIQEPIRSTEGERQIRKFTEENLPPGRAGVYNQALMDLGATICIPKDPRCEACPVRDHCQALVLGVQGERPVKLPRKKVPRLTVTAAVIRRDGRVLLAQRPKDGLLGGMWEFPGGTQEEGDSDLEACLRREIQEELGVDIQILMPFGEYKHAYTHFKIDLYAFICELTGNQEPRPLESDGLVWIVLEELNQYPMGKVDRKIARRLMKEGLDGKRAN